MTVTNGYVERAIICTHANGPISIVPIGPEQDPETVPVIQELSVSAASVEEVQEHLRGRTDAKVRSRAVSIRRAYLRLEEKGLVERVEKEGNRQYWGLTDAGIEEANSLYEGYTEELADLKKRYGGDWAKTTGA